MRELRTATIVANEVSMLRAGMRGPIVLVEGDSDTRLYRKFMLPTPHVRLTHCDGNQSSSRLWSYSGNEEFGKYLEYVTLILIA
jgi:hypothetical protein